MNDTTRLAPSMPARVRERRDDLLRFRQAHIESIATHEQELRMCKAELAAIDGEINGIDLTVSAYLEEAAAPAMVPIETKPRAARRDIRSMVLEAVKNSPHGASAAAIGSAIEVRPAQVRAALEYWRDKGEITLRGDVARPGSSWIEVGESARDAAITAPGLLGLDVPAAAAE